MIVLKSWIITVIFGLFLVIPVSAQTEVSVSAASAVLYDPLSETVLFAKNEDVPRGMASTTKIMTALVALDTYDLSQTVEIKREWCGIEGSSMYLKPGEALTISDLLYGLLLVSGNDAAEALAGLDAQGTSGFVGKMNAKAQALNLMQTHFDNPSGLDGETHYTTALELAKITASALENPVLCDIVSTQSAQVAGRWLKNHNRLLAEIDACGVKTGYTKSCGRCLVSAKQQNGRMLICVTLNAPNDWEDHKKLYEYGFSQYEWSDLLGAGDCGSIPLISSEKKCSRIYCNESFGTYLTKKELSQIQTCLIGPRFVYGSVSAGELYGSLQVCLNQHVLFETPVYFGSDSDETQPERNWLERCMDFMFRRREH